LLGRQALLAVDLELLDALLHDVDVGEDELAAEAVELLLDVLTLVALEDREEAVALADRGELARVRVLVGPVEDDRVRVDDLHDRRDELLLLALDLVHLEDARVEHADGG